MNDMQLLRYSRHILLDEIDLDGQEKMNCATVLVIGCGGLGNACVPLLAGSGIGHLILCDDDQIELSNLPRQTAFTLKDVQHSKVETLKNYVLERNPDLKVSIVQQRMSNDVLKQYLAQCDVIVDCSDNAATRYQLNQASVSYKVPLVSASVIQFSGQLMVFNPSQKDSPCYACMFPVAQRDETSCFKNGVFAPLVHIIGAAQAAEVLKLLVGMGESSVGKMTQFEGLNFESDYFYLDKDPNCSVCSKQSSSV